MQALLLKSEAVKTARGVLSKGWYQIGNSIYLVKGNSVSKIHGGIAYEPYSEVMACRIANLLGFNCIEYRLMPAHFFPKVKVFGISHVSVCKIHYVQNARQMSFYDYILSKIGREPDDWFEAYKRYVGDMLGIYQYLILDAITGNPDRHLTNIDIIVGYDGSVRVFPIFDCGASLLAWATDDADLRLDVAKPFRSTHSEQIKLVPRIYPYIELQPLFNQILYSIKDILELLPEERMYSIVEYLRIRLPMLKQVMLPRYIQTSI